MIENQLSSNEKMMKMINELNNLFMLFNNHFYNDELESPILLIQTTAGEKAKGWCTVKKVWKDNKDGEHYYEIAVGSEFLYEGMNEICDTLLHEMAHLYNLQHDIQDTSRGGTYHNAKFKATAEQHGINVANSDKYGWSSTSLKDETKQFIKQKYPENPFILTRQNHFTKDDESKDESDKEKEDQPKKKSSKRYVCPECNTIVRASKEVNIVCGDCGCNFEEKEREDNDE